ncbi:GNAT family N-acetyltransferase [Ancylobacter amanitiformis]|uniref:GNAT superfamily N-acetyltransferase n=1 Tax=Ancylobacter amanitiformis TaxID=217069 RepID=A0ABU0LRB1_9HYPH|nr:GNAT family N-acetyltransferase [Ancylobacter amanitiformis]MDQ0511253.1 GNAT superfamily N-acetyltransferase [Ancylobacter amanitiformis]
MEADSPLRIRHAIGPDDIAGLARLWAEIGWGSAEFEGEEQARKALAGSGWIAIAEVDGRFAGYARALTDGVLVTYLVEVAVVADLRRRGIGAALIRSCLSAFPHTALYADAGPLAVGLLERHGIVPRPAYYTACARGPQRPVA